MGYHVTILRTKSGAPVRIERDEFETVLATRPDLEARPTAEGELEIVVRALGDESPLLVWDHDGEIWTKNPDDPTMQLLLELAKPLGARVRGDEGETYRTPDESYEHPDDAATNAADREASRREWRRRQWTARLAPIVVAVVVGLVYGYCSRR